MLRNIVASFGFVAIGAVTLCSQTQDRLPDPPIKYHLLHELGKRSDGGFTVYLKVTNLSSTDVGLALFKYKVEYCPDLTCGAGAEQLSPVPPPGGRYGGSFGLMPLAADETKEFKEDFYGGDAPGIGVFVVSRPGIYKVQAAQTLYMGKHGPWSNELVIRHSPDGSWSLVDADPRED
jgi:hypothetical protein